MTRTKVAVIGSGNIGTDLMIKVLRLSEHLEMGAMVGIDPDSDGLRRAQRLGVPTTAHGVRGLVAMQEFDDIAVIFDATSATAHLDNARLLAPHGKALVDLTPAAIGPFVVPAVNLHEHLERRNVNMVTCG
ncbi:MAG: acetaldehyde dehydrogenase, partial [Mycobacterium sp.]